jgi:hypothetical protein
MQNIEWKPLKEYKGVYEINSLGEIISLHRRNPNRLLTQRIDRAGYYTVRLSLKGKTATKLIHRLIAETFIPNLDNKPYVNHINGIKTDNAITNLEWVTHSENIKHAFDTGLWKVPDLTKRKLFDECSNRTFDSIKEASDYYGINHSTLRNRLRTRNKRLKCLKYLNERVR